MYKLIRALHCLSVLSDAFILAFVIHIHLDFIEALKRSASLLAEIQ